jgi:hypothetical protein
MTLCGTRTRVTAGKRRLPGADCELQYNLSAAVAGSSAATTKGMSILAAGFCNQASYMQRRAAAAGFFAAQIARD